jgi:hypothetical protein
MILSNVPTQVDQILRWRSASDFNSVVEREILKLGVQQLPRYLHDPTYEFARLAYYEEYVVSGQITVVRIDVNLGDDCAYKQHISTSRSRAILIVNNL